MGSFNQTINKMDIYLRELKRMHLFSLDNLGDDLPKEGVYVLYENGMPLYVGRSRDVRRRIAEHRRQSGDHYTSSFAFLLAREIWIEEGNAVKSRNALSEDSRFMRIFIEQKKRIFEMKVRAVGISDHFEQAIFEIYASIQLKSKYNSFKTH